MIHTADHWRVWTCQKLPALRTDQSQETSLWTLCVVCEQIVSINQTVSIQLHVLIYLTSTVYVIPTLPEVANPGSTLIKQLSNRKVCQTLLQHANITHFWTEFVKEPEVCAPTKTSMLMFMAIIINIFVKVNRKVCWVSAVTFFFHRWAILTHQWHFSIRGALICIT